MKLKEFKKKVETGKLDMIELAVVTIQLEEAEIVQRVGWQYVKDRALIDTQFKKDLKRLGIKILVRKCLHLLKELMMLYS